MRNLYRIFLKPFRNAACPPVIFKSFKYFVLRSPFTLWRKFATLFCHAQIRVILIKLLFFTSIYSFWLPTKKYSRFFKNSFIFFSVSSCGSCPPPLFLLYRGMFCKNKVFKILEKMFRKLSRKLMLWDLRNPGMSRKKISILWHSELLVIFFLSIPENRTQKYPKLTSLQHFEIDIPENFQKWKFLFFSIFLKFFDDLCLGFSDRIIFK